LWRCAAISPSPPFTPLPMHPYHSSPTARMPWSNALAMTLVLVVLVALVAAPSAQVPQP